MEKHAANTNIKVFGLNRPGLEPTIYRNLILHTLAAINGEEVHDQRTYIRSLEELELFYQVVLLLLF